MTSLFAQRRAAEEFAQLVDAPSPGRPHGQDADLLATVTFLREQTAVTPRAEFVADLRARLLAAADIALAPAPATARSETLTPVAPRGGTRRFGTAAAAALVVVGGSAGLAAASQGALPGDTLYPVKRGIESAAVAFNTSEAGRGADLLASAGTRLEEAEVLAAEGAPAERIEDALTDFVDQAESGSALLFTAYQASGDNSQISTVQDFAARTSGVLQSLAESAPGETRPSVELALQSLSDIATQARTLCAACGDELALTGGNAAAGVGFLIGEPVRGAMAQEDLRRQLGDLAAGAEAEADRTPQAGADQPAAGGADGSTTVTDDSPLQPDGSTGLPTDGLADGAELPRVTAPVKNTIKGTTDGVTGLIREITESTPLSPLTDPVTETLDETVDGLTGLLP